MQQPRNVSRRSIGQGQFLQLELVDYIDARGQQRDWEVAGRRGEQQAVTLIARLVPSNRLVFVRQYRPPAGAYVVEFPAGMIDRGETAEQAALRELHEETGYTGRVLWVAPPALSTPGMCSEAFYLAGVEIDEHSPANTDVKPHLDDMEDIEVTLISESEAPAWLREQRQRGARMDAKVVVYFAARGIDLG